MHQILTAKGSHSSLAFFRFAAFRFDCWFRNMDLLFCCCCNPLISLTFLKSSMALFKTLYQALDLNLIDHLVQKHYDYEVPSVQETG
jgi:hypothetical protein